MFAVGGLTRNRVAVAPGMDIFLMTTDTEVASSRHDAGLSPAELAQERELIRNSRAGLAADKRLIAESRQSVEESKKRLAIKPQKL